MRPRSFSFGLVLAAASGLMLFAANEPLAAGPLAWVALVPLFLAVLAGKRRWAAAVDGGVCGVVFFGLHLSWIFLFGWMAWLSLTGVLALGVALAAWLGNVVRRFPIAPVILAGCWTGVELVRDRWPWSGFAWGALGTTQGAVPSVRVLVPAVGTYGISFLVAFAAALIADRIFVGKLSWGSLVLVGIVLAGFVAVDAVRYRPPHGAGRPTTVAVIQGNVPRPPSEDQDDRIVASHIRLTREAVARARPDLVVWPEAAVGYDTSRRAAARVGELARETGVPMLVGWERVDEQAARFSNEVREFDASGRVVAVYQKHHPVPFGEYVPVPFLRRYVSSLGQVPYDMVPGRRLVVFRAGGVRVATPICFESSFPRDVRAFGRAGAELIVVTTNNSSYDHTDASEQHVAQSRMRALENRQWVVQAALSGISAVISPDGRISQRTPLFRPAVVAARVRARTPASLYSRFGDLFAYGWTAGTGLALVLYAFVQVWSLGARWRPRRGAGGGPKRRATATMELEGDRR